MSINSAVRATKLDKIFGTPVCAVLLAILCNILWGSAFPFIKLGYRLFSIDPANTASIFCFAGVRFMLGSVLVLGGSLLLEGRLSALINGEPLFRWQYLGALVLVCIGIWLVNKTPAKKERAR